MLPSRFWAGVAVGAACAAVAIIAALRHLPRAAPPPRCAASFSDLIGGTPLVLLPAVSAAAGCAIFAKLELSNPGGSCKDRVVRALVDAAEARGELRRGARDQLVVEGSSGSTGISLALLAASRAYACVVVMPDDVSPDKAARLRAAGARVELVPPVAYTADGHYVKVARRIAAAEARARGGRGGVLFLDQFDARGNAAEHEASTGPEIWAQAGARVDAFVCAAGTGGTFAGVGAFLKRASRGATRLVLADPPGSVLLRRVTAGVAWTPEQAERALRRHRADTIVEGVGLDRLTPTGARAAALADDAVGVTDAEAVAMARFLLRAEGLFVGSSSALNVVAAVKVARALRAAGAPSTARVVTILCDAGERHLARFWSADALAARGLTGAATLGEARGEHVRGGGFADAATLDFVL